MPAQVKYRYTSHCCRDIKKTQAFYQDVLGFSLVETRDSNHEMTAKLLRMSWPFVVNLVFLEKDAFMIELQDFALHGVRGEGDWVPNRAGLQFVSLDCKDLPGVLRKVATHGGVVLEDTHTGMSCCVLDPDGQVLELLDMRVYAGAGLPKDAAQMPAVDAAWPATTFRHLAQVVGDMPTSRRFYEELLGFSFVLARNSSRPGTAKLLRMPWPMELDLTFLVKDGMELELMRYPSHGTQPAQEWITNRPGLGFCHLDVRDLAQVLKEVPRYGGRVIEETNLGRACIVYDPDGQPVELVGIA